MKRLYTLIVTGLLLFGATMSSHGEDYALWNDNAYDFTKVRTIYVDELNTAPAAIHSPAKEQLMKEDFAKKATTEKWKQTKFIVAPVALPMQDDQTTPATETQPTPAGQHATVERKNVTTADPGAGIASTEPATPPLPAPEATEVLPAPTKDTHIAVPDAAKAAEADLYIKGDVLSYGVGTGLIPAHTEWNTYQVSDVYYGNTTDTSRPTRYSRTKKRDHCRPRRRHCQYGTGNTAASCSRSYRSPPSTDERHAYRRP